MNRMFLSICAQIGTLASFLGLILTLKDKNADFTTNQYIGLGVAIGLFIVSVIVIVVEYNKKKPKVFSSTKDIRNYMYNWINRSGRTLIFTRNLSWVNDDEMKKMLANKSSSGDLIICLPEKNTRVAEFESQGAKVYEYSGLHFTPLSRFTIINYGRADARIAIGKDIGDGKHLIEEYSSRDHPYFSIAEDLVKLVQSGTK